MPHNVFKVAVFLLLVVALSVSATLDPQSVEDSAREISIDKFSEFPVSPGTVRSAEATTIEKKVREPSSVENQQQQLAPK